MLFMFEHRIHSRDNLSLDEIQDLKRMLEDKEKFIEQMKHQNEGASGKSVTTGTGGNVM